MREESSNAARLSSTAASLALLPAAGHNMQDNLLLSIPVVDVIVRYRRNFQVRLRTIEVLQENAAKILPEVEHSSTHTTIEPDLELWNWGFGQYLMSEGFSSALESSSSATVERLNFS